MVFNVLVFITGLVNTQPDVSYACHDFIIVGFTLLVKFIFAKSTLNIYFLKMTKRMLPEYNRNSCHCQANASWKYVIIFVSDSVILDLVYN